MLIYSEKEQLAITLGDYFYIEIDYNDEEKINEVLLHPERLGYFSVYSSDSKKKCQEMLNSILDAYEQGLKVFRI